MTKDRGADASRYTEAGGARRNYVLRSGEAQQRTRARAPSCRTSATRDVEQFVESLRCVVQSRHRSVYPYNALAKLRASQRSERSEQSINRPSASAFVRRRPQGLRPSAICLRTEPRRQIRRDPDQFIPSERKAG